MDAAPNEPYCIILYGHKYGTDAWLARHEDTDLSICDTIVANMADVLDTAEQRAVLTLIADGKLPEAIEEYQGASREWFEVRHAGVPEPETADPVAEAKERLARLGPDDNTIITDEEE